MCSSSPRPQQEPEEVTALTKITIDPIGVKEIAAAADLLHAQQARQHAGDPRLKPARPREQIEASLALALANDGERPLVAQDAQGRVRGFARPSVWEISENSILRAFLSARNGVALDLALPDPADEDALTVAAALLAELTNFWARTATTGALIRWPSGDAWFEPVLVDLGFRLDSVCAFYPRQPLASPRHPPTQLLSIRRARPEDEEFLVELLDEELRFHEQYTPFVRSSPDVLMAFRRKLARLWAGATLEDGAPLILVAEHAGEIAGMGENTLLLLGENDEPGFTPPGRYACIDNVSVRGDMRGQGIGRLLTQAAFDAFAQTGFDAYVLWYNPDNTLAARVWTHLGFQTLWTTYQRLHAEEGSPRGA